MKKLIMLLASLLLCPGFVFAAAWVNPWDTGANFDDPFKKNNTQQQKPAEKPKQTAKPAKKKSEKKNLPGQMPPVPSKPAMPPAKPGINLPQQASPVDPDADPAEGAYLSPKRNIVKQIAPMGIEQGITFPEARTAAMSMGFQSMGNCDGNGEFWVQDPVSGCAVILFKGRDRIESGSFAVSGDCMKRRADAASWGNWILTQEGEELNDGTLVHAVSAPNPMICMQNVVLDNDFMPAFMEYIVPGMLPDAVEGVMKAMDAKVVSRHSNGLTFSVAGLTVVYEFCPGTKEMLGIGMAVTKESPKGRKIIEKMNIGRDAAVFEDAVARRETRGGMVSKVQFDFTSARKRCKSGKI